MDTKTIFTTASVMVLANGAILTAYDDVLRRADSALYRAKAKGRNRHRPTRRRHGL